jgi:acetoin utilization protein AcuB
MIVRDIMTTKLITVEPDDTLARAANLLRQYQFHHLPVAREVPVANEQRHTYGKRQTALLFEGLLTSQDVDMAAALAEQDSSQPWQERRVVEVMHRAIVRVTPITTVAAAAQILVERGLNYLPVIEFGQAEHSSHVLLVGLVTRSDLLMAFARAMGAFEPGMQLDITLPLGDVSILARTLHFASELRMPVRSVMAAPLEGSVLQSATIRLGTINPAPLLLRLQQENIQFSFGSPLVGGNTHVS